MAEEKTPLKWKYKTGDSVYSPAVSDGVVYFGSRDNHLYAVDINTGEEKWKYKTGKLAKSPPIVVDGIVYFKNKKKHLYAVDSNTGKLKWNFKTRQLRSSPAVVDGIVCFLIIGNYIYALDSKTGEEKWKFKTMDNVYSSLKVSDGIIYFGSDDNHLYAVDSKTGEAVDTKANYASTGFLEVEEKWSEAKWKFKTSPVVDGVSYRGDDHHLYAVDKKTGEEKWKFKTGDKVNHPPAVLEGVVYFGSKDGYLYAVDINIAEKLGPAIKADEQKREEEEKKRQEEAVKEEQTELEQKIKDFKKREAEAKDAWDIRKLADEIAEAGYPDRARKLYIKAVETAEKNKTFICYGKTPAVFGEDDVYIMEGGPDAEPITMNGDFGLWIKGERWEWIEIYDNQDYFSPVHVFNRSDGFGILSSNDGEYFGHRSVNIKYKKVKPEILKSKSFADIKIEDLEEDVLVFNYDDIRFNNFMIAGEYILHQKHGEDDTGIFGEKCPWSPYTAEVNKSLFNVIEECVPITPITSKNKYWESLESSDGQEEIESGEFNDREMFRWWGRCEGNVDTCMPVEWEPGLLLDFQGNYSMDYGQVLIRLDE